MSTNNKQIIPKSFNVLSDFGFSLCFNEYFNFVKTPHTNSAFKLIPINRNVSYFTYTLNSFPIKKMNIAYSDNNISWKDNEEDTTMSTFDNKNKIFDIQKVPKQVVKDNYSDNSYILNNCYQKTDTFYKCNYPKCKRLFTTRNWLNAHLSKHYKSKTSN
jgi:hypothetical protein